MFSSIYSFEILKRNISVLNDRRKRIFQQIQERSLFSRNYVFSAHVLQHNANIKLSTLRHSVCYPICETSRTISVLIH